MTGANTGLGKEIAQILYSKNAKVYIMARSEEKSRTAIESIKVAAPKSAGELDYIRLDLADLETVKRSAQAFLARERQLHLLFNNAGVGYPEKGSRTAQGYELQLGVNCIGTFALTRLLTPTLVATAQAAPRGSVRVVWVSSSAAEAIAPKGYIEKLAKIEKQGSFEQYCISKLGNYFHATEFAARYKADGVVSVPINPGNLDSDFWRTQGALMTCILRKTLLHPPVYGAYTALFAAVSPQVTLEKSDDQFGKHSRSSSTSPSLFTTSLTLEPLVAPWGQFWKLSNDMVAATKSEKQGGTGIAKRFWDWTEAQVEPYL